MTAPWIAEAERAVLTAWDSPEHGYLVERGLVDERDAAVAVAAVVPILAEHFAQAVRAGRQIDRLRGAEAVLSEQIRTATEKERADAAEARLAAVRALHAEDVGRDNTCWTCNEDFPCATVRTLDGTP